MEYQITIYMSINKLISTEKGEVHAFDTESVRLKAGVENVHQMSSLV
jgi:hypothetical protein